MNITTQKEAAELIVKVLRKAKASLSRKNDDLYTQDKEIFLCNAVEKTNGYNDTTTFVKDYITRAIDNRFTFNDWLRDNLHQSLCDSLTYADVQTLRHKWVNKMIRELTAQYINVQ